VLEWSDDDEDLTARPPSTKEPPLHAEVPIQRAKEIPAQPTMEVLAVQMTGVPEQQMGVTSEQHVERAPEHQMDRRSSIEEREPPQQSTEVDHVAAPRGSGRYRRFKKLNRKTKP